MILLSMEEEGKERQDGGQYGLLEPLLNVWPISDGDILMSRPISDGDILMSLASE